MPRIFDNIERALLPALRDTLTTAERADFCVGYFNLRGWRALADAVERWPGGAGHCCRLLIGMHISADDELRRALRQGSGDDGYFDNASRNQEKRRIADDFRRQLLFGTPTNADEATLRQLARQLRAGQLVVKVYLRQLLHAKLYLLYRQDANNPVTGFLGSSNLTFAGLAGQGELNVDVLEHDACSKLARWFEDRWNDRACLDISQELAAIIEQSWAREELIPPYHVYLKMAYHLAQEARVGIAESVIPACFNDVLLEFQEAAVKIAAHRVRKRGGVLLGDVVGLGKSMIATALAKALEEQDGTETLIICPKNLVKMWEDYAHRYRLGGCRVLSLSQVINELPEKTRRYRVVLIDEAHNLRNNEGKRYQVIREYIERNDSYCILLSATPYNKTYLDLSAQLGLFVRAEADLGIRPEKLLSALGGEAAFMHEYQCPVRSLAAFEKSEQADDWRDLMRLYMVRRTRSFIMQNYTQQDKRGKYLRFKDGRKAYFPLRVPKNIVFALNANDPRDPYARLYADHVVETINTLYLPRYGLGNYVAANPQPLPTAAQGRVMEGLSRAGTRLKGFCRTNLFKRLESAGPAFILSIERHILRNFVVLHALEQNRDIPLGAQNAELLDTRYSDIDTTAGLLEDLDEAAEMQEAVDNSLWDEAAFRERAAKVYARYAGEYKKRFKWLPGRLFQDTLAADLLSDARALLKVLQQCENWQPAQDAKLAKLAELVNQQHAQEKVLVFTQFADTACYLVEQLRARGVQAVEAVTGQTLDPTDAVWRFAPMANNKRDKIKPDQEIRVLIATDVLSEGQNLQDCALVVNYDLPWAIIRLIQRAGRVDRIGQQAERIFCYSFLPTEGVERLIRLRERVQQRLQENREVVGSDEAFFADDTAETLIRDLYTEKSGVLDEAEDNEVDLASYAYQIWKNATDNNPTLKATIEALPDVVYASKAHTRTSAAPNGVLVYMRTAQNNDALAWMNEYGESVTQSQLTILQAAACEPETAALPRSEQHHALTEQGMAHILEEEKNSGGSLGPRSGARFKTYERIKQYRERVSKQLDKQQDLLITDEFVRRLESAQQEIYRYPLYQTALDALRRHFKTTKDDDERLAHLVLALQEEGRLCVVDQAIQEREPQLICSLGLI